MLSIIVDCLFFDTEKLKLLLVKFWFEFKGNSCEAYNVLLLIVVFIHDIYISSIILYLYLKFNMLIINFLYVVLVLLNLKRIASSTKIVETDT